MALSSNASAQAKRDVSKKVFNKFLTSLPLNPYTKIEVQKADGTKDFVRNGKGDPYAGMMVGNAPLNLRKMPRNYAGSVVFNHDNSTQTFVEGTTALEGNETAAAAAATEVTMVRMRTGKAITDFEADRSEIDNLRQYGEFIARSLREKVEIEMVKALCSTDYSRTNTFGVSAGADDAWYAANLAASRVHFVDHAACIAASTTDLSVAGAALDAGDVLTAAVAKAVLAKVKSKTGARLTPFEIGAQSQRYLWLMGSVNFEQLANDSTILGFHNAAYQGRMHHPGLGANVLRYRNFEIVEVPEIDNYQQTDFGGAGVHGLPSFVVGVGGLATAIAREGIHQYKYDADGTMGVGGTLWMGSSKLRAATSNVDAEILTVFSTAA